MEADRSGGRRPQVQLRGAAHAQLAELDAKIAAESDPKKKAKLEAEKATKEQWLNAIK